MQSRFLPTIILGWLALTAASAAQAGQAAKPATASAAGRELTVSARAVERPLMKYRLMPAEYQLRDGNAAPILLRLPWDQTEYFSTVAPTFTEYLDIPLDDPKLLGAANVFPSRFYEELKRAAYRRTAEWEYPFGEKPVISILLPDVQGSRLVVGRGLSVWIRHQIAHNKLDEAREGILVGLANSRHYGRTPFVITQLVCVAIDSMMLSRLEEMLAHPDCPNMYWALTALPRPLVKLRPSIELEQRFLQMSVPGLENLDELRTEAQWTERAQAVIELFQGLPGRKQSPDEAFGQILARLAKRARAEPSDWTEETADRIAAMSDAEAGLRWFLNAHKDQSQETAALMSLEPPAAIPRLKSLQTRLADFRTKLGVRTLFVLENPLHAYLAAHRVQRRINVLRVVEAIRNYGATHQSQLPQSLEQIEGTPVPNDLLTGKPFDYEVNQETATLTAPGFNVDGRVTGAIHYRIGLRK